MEVGAALIKLKANSMADVEVWQPEFNNVKPKRFKRCKLKE